MTSIKEILEPVESKLTSAELETLRRNILMYVAAALMDTEVSNEVLEELTSSER